MKTVIKRFDELSGEEVYNILKVRSAVFVVEQNCVYQDLDDVDKEAYHVYMEDSGQIVAYLRVVDKGKRLDEVSVGRVISLKRRCGLGSKLMKVGLQVAQEKFHAKKVKVGAQVYAKPFYVHHLLGVVSTHTHPNAVARFHGISRVEIPIVTTRISHRTNPDKTVFPPTMYEFTERFVKFLTQSFGKFFDILAMKHEALYTA